MTVASLSRPRTNDGPVSQWVHASLWRSRNPETGSLYAAPPLFEYPPQDLVPTFTEAAYIAVLSDGSFAVVMDRRKRVGVRVATFGSEDGQPMEMDFVPQHEIDGVLRDRIDEANPERSTEVGLFACGEKVRRHEIRALIRVPSEVAYWLDMHTWRAQLKVETAGTRRFHQKVSERAAQMGRSFWQDLTRPPIPQAEDEGPVVGAAYTKKGETDRVFGVIVARHRASGDYVPIILEARKHVPYSLNEMRRAALRDRRGLDASDLRVMNRDGSISHPLAAAFGRSADSQWIETASAARWGRQERAALRRLSEALTTTRRIETRNPESLLSRIRDALVHKKTNQKQFLKKDAVTRAYPRTSTLAEADDDYGNAAARNASAARAEEIAKAQARQAETLLDHIPTDVSLPELAGLGRPREAEAPQTRPAPARLDSHDPEPDPLMPAAGEGRATLQPAAERFDGHRPLVSRAHLGLVSADYGRIAVNAAGGTEDDAPAGRAGRSRESEPLGLEPIGLGPSGRPQGPA